MLCPRCEKPIDESHDAKACDSSGLTRRFFFGLLGATSAALAMRLDGIPLPAAQHIVVARAGDYLRVEANGVFAIAWERPKHDRAVKRYEEGHLIEASDIQKFTPQDVAAGIYVNEYLPEMRIVSVIDDTTHKPLEFRVIRGEEIRRQRRDAEKLYEEQRVHRERQRLASREMRFAPQGVETFFRIPVEGDYVKRATYGDVSDLTDLVLEPACGGDPRVCYRALPGWDMVYSFRLDGYRIDRHLPENLRRLSQGKWGKHPAVSAAIDRLRHPGRRVIPRLPA